MQNSTKQQALITGASSGIGKSTALAFAAAGIDLALVSRTPEKLEEVAQTARQAGVTAKSYPVDLGQVNQVQKQIGAIIAEFGPVDILVNSAGMAYTGPLRDTALTDWQRLFDLNLTSVWPCTLAVLPGMRQQGRGTVINVVSIAAHQVFPNWGAYCASKFALLALSKALAAEERANGIRVTAISPGSVNTPIWDTETVQADFDRSAMLTPEAVAQSILHAVQLPAEAVLEELILMPTAGVF